MKNKKKKVNDIDKMTDKEVTLLQNDYLTELKTNPEFSLEVDPENKYNMSEGQKNFIRNYVQFKNVGTAAELAGIDGKLAKQYFIAYNSQVEIRRINRALYHRQFHQKMLDLDEIGGYLSSLITDEHVPLGSQLKPNDKLKAVDMLMELHKFKRDSLENPENVIKRDISSELKDLSITTIQKLLDETSKNKNDKKGDIISNSNLTPEEKEYLNTLPTEELLQLIEETNKGGSDNNE